MSSKGRVRAAICSRNGGHKSSALTLTPIHVTVAKFSPGAMSMKMLPGEHNEHQHCPLHAGKAQRSDPLERLLKTFLEPSGVTKHKA